MFLAQLELPDCFSKYTMDSTEVKNWFEHSKTIIHTVFSVIKVVLLACCQKAKSVLHGMMPFGVNCN